MLTGLEPTFMGVTRSKSGLFRSPGFIVSPLGKGERGKKRRREGRKKGIEKEWKEGLEGGIKKDQSKDKKKEF